MNLYDFSRMLQDILGNLCGFVVIVIAVMLLNSFKEIDLSCYDLRIVMRCRRDDHIKYVIETDEEAGQIKPCLRQSTYGTPEL